MAYPLLSFLFLSLLLFFSVSFWKNQSKSAVATQPGGSEGREGGEPSLPVLLFFCFFFHQSETTHEQVF